MTNTELRDSLQETLALFQTLHLPGSEPLILNLVESGIELITQSIAGLDYLESLEIAGPGGPPPPDVLVRMKEFFEVIKFFCPVADTFYDEICTAIEQY